MFIYLLFMSLLAGILNGIVGMASLTLYPVLLSVGVTPISANATITLAQLSSGVSACLSAMKELKAHWKQAVQVALVSALGGAFGALILIKSSNGSFQKLVPIFILVAGVMMLLPNRRPKDSGQVRRWVEIVNWVALFLVGIYGGYFGAGAGLLMIAVLSRVIHQPYAVYNAMRLLGAFVTNIVATLMFVFFLPVAWHVVIPLVIGLFIGGYLGPIIVRYIPSKVLKMTVGIFAIALSVFLAFKTYR